MGNGAVYLDNAATSFPKPEEVYTAVLRAMREECGNPGRSGHRFSLAAGRAVQDARVMCGKLFNAESPDCIAFSANATVALNIGIKGVLRPGNHVITSAFEHNSVSRPLSHLERDGVSVTKLPMDLECGLSTEDIKEALRPDTRLVVCTHVSNVTGTANDIASIGALCKDRGILFMVDAAQSAGCRAINVRDMHIDLLAFAGHKGVFGPQGTGGLYVRPGVEMSTIMQGGTGRRSESLVQPEVMPDKLETGTRNSPGLAGLAAGIRFVLDAGIEEIERKEASLANRLIKGIAGIDGARVAGPGLAQDRSGIVSVILENVSSVDAALMMDAAFNIAVRGGLHCAADAHISLGSADAGGALRISPGYFNTEDEIDCCLAALEACVAELRVES